MGNNNVIEKKISLYNKKTEELKTLYDKIKLLKEKINKSDDISLINESILTYEKIFEIDNTKEIDILEYLLLFFKLFHFYHLIDLGTMKSKLDLYNAFISDEKYNQHFNNFDKRTNSFTKILNLIELLKTDLGDDDKNMSKRKKYIHNIIELDEKEKEKNNTKYTHIITWENKELFLFNLYMMFLESLSQKINFYKTATSSNALNSKEYHELFDKYILAKGKKGEEQALNEFQLFNVIIGEFFTSYVLNLQTFLKKVNNKFEKRFKNNNFISEDDKYIIEDYIQFLSSYEFKIVDDRITYFWNETFIPYTKEEKEKTIEKFKTFYENEKCELKDNTLYIKKNGKEYQVKDIDKYILYNLVHDLFRQENISEYFFDYYLNKNIKPNFYPNNLFIMKNKERWKQLNISILNSKAVKESISNLFQCSFIDFFGDQENISKIIDNIKFFIYEAPLYACSNKNSLRIYEYGLYNNEKNMSESLLSFYSFNNNSNIHEICGHVNIQLQNLYLDKDKSSIESPPIDNNNKLYSEYAQQRQKESGETLEILLYGKKINELTTKEALFILEPSNYCKGLDYFKINFNKCNSKSYKEIVEEITIYLFLEPLGIKIDELPKKNNIYENKIKISKTNQKSAFNRELGNHPPEFYLDIDRQFIEYILNQK